MKDIPVSASGERAAMSGYKHQYDLFAQSIYDEMINNNLVCISVASDKVGKLDDIFYETKDSIYAYQIKWSIDDDIILSINDFKNLVADIANSWKRIQQGNSKPVKPYLLTNRHVSKKYDPDTAINEIKDKTKLSDKEFIEFTRVFQYKENCYNPNFLVTNADIDIRTSDILKLHRLIEEAASSTERRVKYSCADLIKKLHWEYRFNRRFNHDLFVDEDLYVPIKNTVEKLKVAIESHHSGYIFLQGIPGSGKSSLLSQFAKYSSHNVATYYAFDFLNPSSPDNIYLRGEAVSLFHDLVLSLNERGYHIPGHIVSNDLKELRDMFFAQLKLMHEDYKKDGNRTILVIDGLDHIIREYRDCEHEFISLLPLPKSIPDGITIILGSQHFNNSLTLPHEIQSEYKDKSRVVKMDALSREEIILLINKTLPTITLTNAEIDIIINKSQGHPLYLTYIKEAIRNEKNISATLKALPEYDSNVGNYYRNITANVLVGNSDITHLLGLLSRINDEVNWEFIKEWNPSPSVINIFVTKIKPLLKYNEKTHALSFFHNSFRQFLLGETGRDAMTGDIDESKVERFYSELADLYLKSKVEKYWRAYQYLYLSKRYKEFLKLATPAEFSKEVLLFRSLHEIEHDTVYGLYIGRNLNDPYIVLRYMLSKSEVEQRKNQDYSALTFVDDFIDLGEIELAKSLLHRGNTLLCNEISALISARKFYAIGDKEEARLLFDMAYPKFLYKRKDPFGHSDNFNYCLDTLKEWLYTATYFYRDDQLNNYLASFTKNLFDSQDKNFNHHSQKSIYAALEERIMLGLFDLGEIERFKSRLKAAILNLDKNQYTAFNVLRYAINENWKHNKYDSAKKYLDILNRIYGNKGPHVRIIIAYINWNLYHEVKDIKPLIEGISYDQLSTHVKLDINTPIESFRPMYRLVFLRKLCGYKDSVTDIVPDIKSEDNESGVINTFARNLCVLSRMAADGELGNKIHHDFDLVMKGILLFYQRIDNRNRYYYTLNGYRAKFYKIAISVASHYGNVGLFHIRNILKDIFAEFSVYADVRREVALELYRYDYNTDDLRNSLMEVENSMLNSQDQTGRMEQFTKQGRAWLEYGDRNQGINCFRKVLNETFNVGYSEDYQVSWFTKYTRKINEIEPERSIERLLWITKRLRHVDTITDASSHSDIVNELLESAFSYNIASGLKMYRWMLNNEFTTFINGFAYMIEGVLPSIDTKQEYCMVIELFCSIFLFVDDYEKGHSFLLKKIIQKGRLLYGGNLPDEFEQKIKHAIKTECIDKVQEVYLKLDTHEPSNCVERIPNGRDDNDAFTWISKGKKALRDGDRIHAWQYAEKAITLSRASGWIKFYDGGSRIFTFQLMAKIDKAKSHKLAMKTFVGDLAHDYSYGMTQYIDDILSLMTDDVDKKKVYREWSDYMNRLLRKESVNKLDCPGLLPEQCSVTDIVIKFLIFLGSSLVSDVYERAAYLLAVFLDQGFDKIVNYLKNEGNDKLTLDVGKFLIELKSSKLSLLESAVIPLALSRNILWRIYAVDILNVLHLNIPEVSKIKRPVIYDFEYEANGIKLYDNKGKGIIKKGNDHKTGDPFIGFLSNTFRVSKDIIYYRANQLALHYTSERELTDEADRRLLNHLDQIHLKMPFLHTYSYGILNGIMEVAGELMDSNSLSLDNLRFFLTLYDHSTMTWPISEKPDFIQHIEIDQYHSLPKNWENEAIKSLRLNRPLETLNSYKIIGESTILHSTNDGNPWEKYMQMISPAEEDSDRNDFFGDMPFHHLSKDYYNLHDRDNQPVVVVRNSYFIQFSHKANWIALNPEVAKILGWLPAEDHLFGWKDKKGAIMVESIYWSYGNTQNMGLRWSETGEGWLVIASPKAVEDIKQYFKNTIIQRKRLVRTYNNIPHQYDCVEE